MTNKIINIVKHATLATICSVAFSLALNVLVSQMPNNIHWVFSIAFHILVAFALGILALFNPSPKVIAANLLSISLGRLLASGIAFLIYSVNFTELQEWFMIHFMTHYALFTFFEILFLLKIVKPKTTNK